MVRIAIVEDEIQFTRELTGYLKQYQEASGEEFEITAYRDGDGITANYRAQYDIILMDIQMKFVDGMSAAEEIRKVDPEVLIIFITNTPQYAIRGYEVRAFDYVLKPISYFAFSEKLGKALAVLENRVRKFITISVKGGMRRLDVSDIYYVESRKHDLIYHTGSGDYVSNGTMQDAEKQLADMNFSRGNRCYLINLAHVEGVQDKCAVVRGEELLLSRPRKSAFMQDLTRYWGEWK